MPHDEKSVEPWLRDTRQQTPAVLRAVLHALDLASEDFSRWAWPIPPDLLEEQPHGLPSVGFQARHIARSLDRLLTYAEGSSLSEHQRTLLADEHLPDVAQQTRLEFEAAIQSAEKRVLALPLDQLADARYVGTAKLPVSLAGLLVHVADHTQRHVGQAVTTAKVLLALHGAEQS